MQVEAVAPGYHTEAVNEYQPDKENFKLGLKLLPMESDWEQITVPLRASDGGGKRQSPHCGATPNLEPQLPHNPQRRRFG